MERQLLVCGSLQVGPHEDPNSRTADVCQSLVASPTAQLRSSFRLPAAGMEPPRPVHGINSDLHDFRSSLGTHRKAGTSIVMSLHEEPQTDNPDFLSRSASGTWQGPCSSTQVRGTPTKSFLSEPTSGIKCLRSDLDQAIIRPSSPHDSERHPA